MNVISPKDSAIQKLLPILIILLVTAAFAPLLNRTLTYDEAFTYNQYASQGIGRTLIAYTTPNNHILHTALVWLTTTTIGKSELAIRLPAFFAGLLAIAMSYRLVRRYTKSSGMGLVAMALLAAQAGFVLYSVSARGYTLTMLLTLVGLYLLNNQNLPARVGNYGLMFASMGLIMTLPTMVLGMAALFLLSNTKPPIVIGSIAGAMFYMPAIGLGVFSDQAALHGATFEALAQEFDRLFISATSVIVLVGLVLLIIKRPMLQKDSLKFVIYAGGLALLVVVGQLMLTGKT